MSALAILPGEGKTVRVGGLGVVFKLDEVSYVLEGAVTAQVGDRVIEAPAGSLVYKPRGIRHTFWNASGEAARPTSAA